MRAEISGFHNAGPAAGGHNEPAPSGRNLNGPFGQQIRHATGILVISRHIDSGLSPPEFLRQLSFTFFLEAAHGFLRGSAAGQARRSEKYDGILDLLAAKASQRFHVLRHDTENAAVGTVEKGFVLVRQRRRLGLVITHRSSL